jgi:hypothetical protein
MGRVSHPQRRQRVQRGGEGRNYLRAHPLWVTLARVRRIIAQVAVGNPFEPEREIRFDASVNTGSALTVLPAAWKDRLGKFKTKPRDLKACPGSKEVKR